ncbi:MAG: CPBP family intramembrane metalloprotease [Anaerolineaceae bacterium]|nr:CPBP family intramembrane metalloprotease [Anaerolineaceae bacterium]
MKKLFLSILLVLGCAAVFVLGSPFYTIFPTNSNLNYYVALSILILVLSIACKKNEKLARFWPSAYAFLIASVALVFLKIGILNLPRDESNPLQFLALDKLSQFLHIVPVILGLTLVARDDLKSIFIKKGNLKRGLTFGLISFTGFAAVGLVMQWNSSDFFPSLPAAIPWLLLFVFTNAIMEELWFRAIFLKKFEMLVGRKAAIIITALAFGASHINATYDFPGGGFVFGCVVFGLGLVGAHAMLKDDSLIGPVFFHAGYDLMIMVSILNSL